MMLNSKLNLFSNRIQIRRGLVFGGLIVAALLAFELFNYSTTDFALSDLLGDLKFVGVRWATILSIAFCGIDFAGIAKLFTPEQGKDEPAEVWYLFGAWMLAAIMNAILTWWGVSIAILNHQTLGNAIVARETLLQVVPIFVAVMVWLSRVLIIGTISVAGDHFFNQKEASASSSVRTSIRKSSSTRSRTNNPLPTKSPLGNRLPRGVSRGMATSSYRSAPKPEPTYEPDYSSNEPTYSPVSFNSNQNSRQRQTRF